MNVDDMGKKFSCQDSPTPVLKIQYNTIHYEEISNTLPHRSPAFITDKQIAFTIPSCTYAVINFPVLVITSLPAVAVLTKYP